MNLIMKLNKKNGVKFGLGAPIRVLRGFLPFWSYKANDCAGWNLVQFDYERGALSALPDVVVEWDSMISTSRYLGLIVVPRSDSQLVVQLVASDDGCWWCFLRRRRWWEQRLVHAQVGTMAYVSDGACDVDNRESDDELVGLGRMVDAGLFEPPFGWPKLGRVVSQVQMIRVCWYIGYSYSITRISYCSLGCLSLHLAGLNWVGSGRILGPDD
ncbi:hypothetical protein ACLB2K_066148 [Fragaria x ananassa]